MSRSRCRYRVRFFERTFRVSVKSQNEGNPAFDREMDPIYWRYLVLCFVQSFVPWQIAATKSDIILEAFVPPGRKPMTPPKVDVSTAEASTSLVNNKSVALPTRSPRATGLAIVHSGCSSAKLTQGTSSELENEAEEEVTERGCRLAEDKPKQHGGRGNGNAREKFEIAAEAIAMREARQGDRDGWMGRRRRFQ
ncbi:hypothetical protein ALC53_02327 [Atta colombica]|uniref:Uncharacterized protein n=1 Tax=Atta colombica TaxID=520822 RepID=A0A195BSZ5_9HYME|nr:hypothetical protein ALC53_02327 [Atta colombica]